MFRIKTKVATSSLLNYCHRNSQQQLLLSSDNNINTKKHSQLLLLNQQQINKRKFHISTLQHLNNKNIKSISIGNIELFNINNKLSVKDSLNIPNYNNLLLNNEEYSKDLLSHLKWMAMKDKLGQDMFLIGHYGEFKRELVFTYCQLANRPIEYICITRDTSEFDFKQRKEILNAKHSYFIDQSAVRAAKNGSILILDGIEKAERNILPILNNLLENREMALEDGSFLISSERYEALMREEGKTKEELEKMKIIPVHSNFRIIALGLPIPPYHGNSLDPPLRSRFQSRKIDLPSLDFIYKELMVHNQNNHEIQQLTSEKQEKLLTILLKFTQSISHLDQLIGGTSNNHSLLSVEQQKELQVIPRFPLSNLKNFIELIHTFKNFISTSEDEVYRLMNILYPIQLFVGGNNNIKQSQQKKVLNEDNKLVGIIREQMRECASSIYNLFNEESNEQLVYNDNLEEDIKELSKDDVNNMMKIVIECNANNTNTITIATKSGTVNNNELKEDQIDNVLFKDTGFISISKHKQTLIDMLKSHYCDRDICLIGSKGSGKSLLSKTFAKLLNYDLNYFPMYKEMTSRDLLQKRATDKEGNTIWKNSILIDSMVNGSLCILDGIDRMNTDILLSIQSLIQHRVLYLSNGTRYLSHIFYDELLNDKGYTKQQLDEHGIFRIHPSFRIIAIAQNHEMKEWLSLELFNLFHFHELPELSYEEKRELLVKKVFSDNELVENKEQLIDSLLKIKEEYNGASFNEEQRNITIRDIIRILQRYKLFKEENLLTLLERTTMSYILPKHHIEYLHKIVNQHSSITHSKSNSHNEENNSIKIEKTKTHLKIDELEITLNPNANPLYIPKPYFIDTDEHKRIMKELLKDHLLKENSLVIGYQGVGKNKITDQLLNLLNCEREYLQLHRDITISSLTVQASVVNGVLTFIDSPLVRAIIKGRILILDEIDKAPLEVVSILKSLIEDKHMVLGDGRRIISQEEYDKRKLLNSDLTNVIPIHPNFRIIALANPPTFPFQGNDFYRENGDIFSCHFVNNPQGESEIKLLMSYGPNVPESIIRKLSNAFDDLRKAVEDNVILYPYSTRELIHIVKHLETFRGETSIQEALSNVFDFDAFDYQTIEFLKKIFEKHEIPFSFKQSEQFTINIAKEIPLTKVNEKKTIGFFRDDSLQQQFTISTTPIKSYISPEMYYSYEDPDSSAFSSSPQPTDKHTDLMKFSELKYFVDIPCQTSKKVITFNNNQSIHVFSTSNPYGFIHFDNYHCDSYRTTELYTISNIFGTDCSFLPLSSSSKDDNSLMLLNAKVLKSNRFLKEDENGNEIIQLNGFIYHLKTKGKFMFELKLQQQNSFGVNTSKIPVQILDNFTDSHQLVCCFQKGLSSIHMIQINLSQQLSQQSKNVWKKEKESYGIVKSRNISLPFQIESIIWLNPNMLFVNDFKDNSKWKLIILENNENYQIKEISYITSFTMNAFHILLSSENTLFSNYNLKERNINNIIKDNNILLSLLNYNNQSDNSSLEILYDLCVKSSPLSPSPMNTGNPLLFNNNHSYLICKYLKHSNQFVLLTKQQLNQKSEDEKENDEYYLSIINFNRNTLRTISLSLFGYSNAVNNTKNMKSANSIFSISELPNGYLTILNCHTNQLFIYNLNIDKLTAEALDWQLYQSNSLNVKNNNEISIEYISHEDNKLKQPSFPKHGMEDDLPHVGGNTYAGGSGGFDTAGLGGVGGPYRLQKKGNPVYQIPDDVKKNLLTSEIIERAKKMANEAYQKRLQEIEMTNEEMNIYQSYKGNVLNQIEQLRKILNDLKWKDEDDERIWMKNQTNGELDDNKIVEGILGEKNIYKRRVNPNELFTKNQNQNMNKQKKKKVLHFVMDVSASMYRFNGQDGRLDRMLEIVVIIMESFKGFEDKFEYRITGHSGQSSNLVFIEKNKPPKNENERLKVLLKMHAHSQYCWSGDSTLLAMKRATTAKEYDDNDFVFIFSDANLARYGIDTKDIQKLLIPTSASSSGSSSKRKKGNFIIFIASLFNEAQKLKETLPSSRCFICFDSKDLAPTFKRILSENVIH